MTDPVPFTVREPVLEPDAVRLVTRDGPIVRLFVVVAELVVDAETVDVHRIVFVMNPVLLIVFEIRIVFVRGGDFDVVGVADAVLDPRTETVGDGAAVAVLDIRGEDVVVLLCIAEPETRVLPVTVRDIGRDFVGVEDPVLLFDFVVDPVVLRDLGMDTETRLEAVIDPDAVGVFDGA